ncbi:uncharacterized protein DUF4270 [Mucilaginibacter frigoritolerans]|jgi:hypothetical protein|uniref:Uncharacterized protein DUF4270 n=1 Tax=Mucilaginibacter frigoritolerans TaxID=652788 RepID=A0A562U132_9SPHI|nr:DUF4270 family protein [Mucilaginibacter frigoritolerans]TWI98810.1 uncharacterized protein DUF4270 [Mucilaginibacter frigoritolerans]
MKFFRLDLLTLLISLFILNSCKNQDSVGLGVQASQVSGSLTDTATIITNTVAEDSVVTSGTLGKNPLAYFNDPIYGLTTSDLATDLNLPGSAAYTLPSGTIFVDSARLVMYYADGFYGDKLTSNYTVNVYQLGENFSSSTSYYNTKSWKFGSTLLGSLQFTPKPTDSIKITSIISGAPDTLIKVAPQLRIPISTSFINNDFFNAGSLALGSNAIFTNYMKGLYLQLDRSKTTGPGGIIMFKAADSLAIYYRAVNGTTIDTAVIYLPITKVASFIPHTSANRSAAVQTELSDSTTSRGVVYLQGLGGLRAKISFPHLLANIRSALAKKDSDIVLNRAELVITVNPGSNVPYAPLPQITLYRLDLAHQRALVPDANSADPRSGGAAVFGGIASKINNSSTNNVPLIQYHFIITAYLQDLLSGKLVDYGTYIAPVDTSSTTSGTTLSSANYLPTSQASARTMAIGGGNLSSPYRMKLNIIYTKIKGTIPKQN